MTLKLLTLCLLFYNIDEDFYFYSLILFHRISIFCSNRYWRINSSSAALLQYANIIDYLYIHFFPRDFYEKSTFFTHTQEKGFKNMRFSSAPDSIDGKFEK